MKFGVIVFPGSNCDHDCYFAINDILKQPVKYIWHRETKIEDVDCIVLPGGFSYGDYLRCGSIAGFSPIMKAIVEFANNGGKVIGICNGFQVLLEVGLLPGAMLKNNTVHFICKYVYLKTENNQTVFTNKCQAGQVLHIPIAHNEGNYYIDNAGYEELKANKQIVFTYSDATGKVNEETNPNGAVGNIAGIINKKGNVLGMMPHPERSMEKGLLSSDGLAIFESILVS